MSDKQTLSQELITEIIKYSDYYHVLGMRDINTINPFEALFKDEIYKDNPHIALTCLLGKPEYFGFSCKHLLGLDLTPFQIAVLQELWKRPFPMLIASRGGSKSFMLAVYCWLKAMFVPNSRIIVTAGAFRQAKIVFDYMYNIWANSPILKDIVPDSNRSGPKTATDRCTFYIGDSQVIAIPTGSGEKIRGLRATTLIAEEFLSIPKQIYEEVISGFAAVAANPSLAHKDHSRQMILQKMGHLSADHKIEAVSHNQSIIAGTCSYEFEHFYEYFERYRKIIESRGDKKILQSILGEDFYDKFSWKDYGIIRIPIEALPPGFMDEKNIVRAKATIDSGVFLKEYACIFPKDSAGFFKRSLIESCTGTDVKPVSLSQGDIWFDASMMGNKNCKYFIGVDPAATQDNFAIVVLEVWPDHRRVVYCWTINMKKHKEMLKVGVIQESNYFAYCARKIRTLLSLYPTERIAIDSQGGGKEIIECLHDQDKLFGGESCIWPTIDEDKPQDSDDMAGLHIIEICSFASAEWTAAANHGMQKDLQDKVLLFPRFDPITIEMASEADRASKRLYDTFEDAVIEIEELKDELSTVVMTRTPTGREHWDTPEVKLSTGKKGRLHKDRYSALLMANMSARTIHRALPQFEYTVTGGLAQMTPREEGPLLTGPSWVTEHEYSGISFIQTTDDGGRKIVY